MKDKNIDLLTIFPKKIFDDFNSVFYQLKSSLIENGLEDLTFDEHEKIFTKSGWCLPYDMPVKEVFRLTSLLKNQIFNEADELLEKYYSLNIKKIKRKLIVKFPERASIINQAFECHKKQYYYASTILFISQADGIAGGKIFMGKYLKSIRKENPEHFLVKIFHLENPLLTHFDLDQSYENSEIPLNRHGIMHGLSLNYGNTLNSLKAISLLSFMSDFDYRIIE